MGKMTAKKLYKHFKNANEVRSVQYSRFKMSDFDLDSIYYDAQFDSFYITDKEGGDHKELYSCHHQIIADIIN